MSIRNIINHTNPGPIIGNITSPCLAWRTNHPMPAVLVSQNQLTTGASNCRHDLRFDEGSLIGHSVYFLIILSLVATLIARYPFAAAARSP